jgi:hypothetical protein
VHTEANMVPRDAYGPESYVIIDPAGGMPQEDPITNRYVLPTITGDILAASIKGECKERIIKKVTIAAQANLHSYVAMALVADSTPSGQQSVDLKTAQAIWDWIGRPDGMQGAADKLIANNDREWWHDAKWPAWNDDWDQMVKRM